MIRETGKPLIRLLGLPFLTAFLYFLYHLFGGLIDAIRSHTLLSFLPGSLLLILMAALFGFPGMILMFGSRKVILDAHSQEIRMIRSYGFFNKMETHSVRDYKSVEALHELRKVTSSQNRNVRHFEVYPVRLTGVPERELEIAQCDGADTARTLAMEVSGVLGLSAKDRTSEWDAGSKPEEEIVPN